MLFLRRISPGETPLRKELDSSRTASPRHLHGEAVGEFYLHSLWLPADRIKEGTGVSRVGAL